MKDKEKQFMLFSERKNLAEEYETWVNQPLKDGTKIKDCPLSVITFMQSKGYRKLPKDSVVMSKEELNDIENKCFDNGFDKGAEIGRANASKETAEKNINDIFKICKQRFNDTKGYTCWGDIEIAIHQYAKQVGVEIKECR